MEGKLTASCMQEIKKGRTLHYVPKQLWDPRFPVFNFAQFLKVDSRTTVIQNMLKRDAEMLIPGPHTQTLEFSSSGDGARESVFCRATG